MRVVYFSPLALASFWQRPHWLADALLRKGIERILWVEPYPTRLPKLSDLRRPSDRPTTSDKPPAAIDRQAVRALPIEPWSLGRAANRLLFFERALKDIVRWVDGRAFVIGIGKPSPLARLAVERLREAGNYCGSFFDSMDHYANFYEGSSRAAMSRWEADLVAAVDRVQVSSTVLRDRYRRVRTDVAVVPNGCDPDIVQQALARHAQGCDSADAVPVYGYVGTLGTWFDWRWLHRFARVLARVSPQAQIHLIGPMFEAPHAALPPQVRLLGTMSNREALTRAASFAAGLMPFVRNELTDCVDPIKYYEYRALGLPVITTPFSDLASRQDPGLLVASTEPEIEAALGRLPGVDRRPAPPEHDWTWSSRFTSLADWILDRHRSGATQRALASATMIHG